jgi:ABC-type Na+ transport system ATPase subunit NatA
VTVIRAIGASFSRAGDELVAPFDLTCSRGEIVSLAQPTTYAASIVARMCAAIVKPTSGRIYVGDYETRLQPPQAKRLVGFVDVSGFSGDDHAFRCETSFRADVWGVDVPAAHARAQDVLAALDARGSNEAAYARAVALALATDVAALVLDQPSRRIATRVRTFASQLAIVTTRVGVTTAPDRALALEPAVT